MVFIADFIACSTCFRNHYAHHQELESIIQLVAACGIWCFGFQVVGMVWSSEFCVRFAGYCSSLSSDTSIASSKTSSPNSEIYCFLFQIPVCYFSLGSSSSCLLLHIRVLSPSIFLSITCFIRQFLRKL